MSNHDNPHPLTVVGDSEPSDAAIEALAELIVDYCLVKERATDGVDSDGATPKPESGSANAQKKGKVPRVR